MDIFFTLIESLRPGATNKTLLDEYTRWSNSNRNNNNSNNNNNNNGVVLSGSHKTALTRY